MLLVNIVIWKCTSACQIYKSTSVENALRHVTCLYAAKCGLQTFHRLSICYFTVQWRRALSTVSSSTYNDKHANSVSVQNQRTSAAGFPMGSYVLLTSHITSHDITLILTKGKSSAERQCQQLLLFVSVTHTHTHCTPQLIFHVPRRLCNLMLQRNYQQSAGKTLKTAAPKLTLACWMNLIKQSTSMHRRELCLIVIHYLHGAKHSWSLMMKIEKKRATSEQTVQVLQQRLHVVLSQMTWQLGHDK